VCSWFGGSTDPVAQGYVSKTVSLGFVMCRCEVRMWWQRSGEGQVGYAVLMDQLRWRMDVRLGPTDQTTGWPAVMADTWDINKRKCTRRETRTGYATRGRFDGLSSKPSEAGFAGLGLKTRAEVLMRTDDTWRHRWDRFRARLPVRRPGSQWIRKLKLDHSALG
jgi:hypothetical protein